MQCLAQTYRNDKPTPQSKRSRLCCIVSLFCTGGAICLQEIQGFFLRSTGWFPPLFRDSR